MGREGDRGTPSTEPRCGGASIDFTPHGGVSNGRGRKREDVGATEGDAARHGPRRPLAAF